MNNEIIFTDFLFIIFDKDKIIYLIDIYKL